MLLGVFAAHSLLLAFALKLRAAAALQQAEPGGGAARNGALHRACGGLVC
jgi:hypothetical protein